MSRSGPQVPRVQIWATGATCLDLGHRRHVSTSRYTFTLWGIYTLRRACARCIAVAIRRAACNCCLASRRRRMRVALAAEAMRISAWGKCHVSSATCQVPRVERHVSSVIRATCHTFVEARKLEIKDWNIFPSRSTSPTIGSALISNICKNRRQIEATGA